MNGKAVNAVSIGNIHPCRACLVAGVALALLGCGPSESAAPRANVLLVVFDTTRFDDWSIFEPERRVTPVVDEIAAAGQRFRNAYSLYSVTVPSHVSLFTGHAAHQPVDHALAADGGAPDDALSDPRYEYRRSSLFSILAERGYRTYAFSGNSHIGKGKVEALDRVDRVLKPRPRAESHAYYRSIADQYGEGGSGRQRNILAEWYERRRAGAIIANNAEYVNREALDAMRDHAANHDGEPYLLFLNYNDAHDPYFPEKPWDERFPSPPDSRFNGNLWSREQRRTPPLSRGLSLSMSSDGLSQADIERARALHLGELAYADHHLGQLLDELERLGMMESTIVVCLADHGEAFGEDGRMAHAGWGDESVVEALLHVPLVMRFPDPRIEPSIIDERVDLRDVKPTLLDYLGIPDDSSRGRSLMPLIRGHSVELPPAEIRPQDRAPETVGRNRIGGQDAETTERLEQELRLLGYAE